MKFKTMNRRDCILAACAAGSSLLLPGYVHAGPNPPAPLLRMGYFDKYPPLSELGRNGKMQGMLIDNMTLAAGWAGLAVEHYGYPWARAQNMVKSGQLDGFCTLATTERKAYASFCPSPILQLPMGAFHRKGDTRIGQLHAIADMRALRQGSYIGSGYTKEFLDVDRTEWEPDVQSVLRRIDKGTLDILIQSNLTTGAHVRALGYSERIQFTPLAFLPVAAFHFGLRKDYPDAVQVVARMESVIQDEKNKSFLQRNVKRYL